MISPAILGEIQTRSNRSSFESNLADRPAAGLNGDSDSTLHNIVDRTSNIPIYYDSRINGLYEDVPEGLEGGRASGGFEGFLRGETYLRQERPYSLSPSNGNFEETSRRSADTDTDVQPVSISHIEESSSNRYSSYHGVGHGPFAEAKPHAGFPGFGPYGHFPGHHHYHHHPYHDHYGNGEAPEENARVERNGTNRRGYGPPYFGDHGYHHSYPSFPYGGYHDYDPFYGPYRRGENDSSANGRHGPHRTDFYGPYDGYNGGYGYGGYGYGGRNNNNNNNNNDGSSSSRQTEEPAENGDRNNGTKNGYPGPYGPHLFKPFLGGFHAFPSPFKLLPYDHHHFLFKGGPVVGVGHVGYPFYADPYLTGFPFHHPYGPSFYGKHGKYLPPDDKPSDSGEQTEAPAGELAENADPGRITALNVEEAAPAPSNRYKVSSSSSLRKSLKRLGLDIENRKV